MTRRAEAEAVLARYGSGTEYGGETFPAFLRPTNFEGSAAGGPRFSYVGPAAHKLSVGGTVTSGGAEYAVKRCETVTLGGEELFVRAVLAPLSGPGGTGVRLERDGKVIARAERCEERGLCGADGTVPFGESAPAEIAGGAAAWRIVLRGLRAENGADLFAPDPFRIVAEQTDGKTVYSGCRWTAIRRAEGPGSEGSCDMEALAAERKEEAKANG